MTAMPKAGSPYRDDCACIDINAELRYWQTRFSFAAPATPAGRFEDLKPTLKFAYDAYLKWHRDPWEMLAPRLQHAYGRLPSRDRLDWMQAEEIIREVWLRIGSAGTCCDGSPAHVHRPASGMRMPMQQTA